jgi:hypothetical protein
VAALVLSACWADVGRPPGWSDAFVADVNKAGVVAVVASARDEANQPIQQSFARGRDGAWTPITGVSRSPHFDGVAAIDESGTAVGYAQSLTGDGTQCAAIWRPGKRARCLGHPIPGARRDVALDVNEHTVVVGQVRNQPFAWSRHRGLKQLPLGPGDTWGRAEAINAGGTIVGRVGADAEFQSDGRAVRWDSPTSPPVELDVDADAIESIVRAVADNGVMVGEVTVASGASRTVVWRPDGSLREVPEGIVVAVSDVGAPVGYVGSQAAVFDPTTLAPTIVGPPSRSSVATEADGTKVAGWITAPDGGTNAATFVHPTFP